MKMQTVSGRVREKEISLLSDLKKQNNKSQRIHDRKNV